MTHYLDFQSQLSSIMDTLAKAAVLEISQLVDGGYAVLRLEVSRSQEENKRLRKQLENLQYMVAQGGAEVPEPPPDGDVMCGTAVRINCGKDEYQVSPRLLDCEMTTTTPWGDVKQKAIDKFEGGESHNQKPIKEELLEEDLEAEIFILGDGRMAKEISQENVLVQQRTDSVADDGQGMVLYSDLDQAEKLGPTPSGTPYQHATFENLEAEIGRGSPQPTTTLGDKNDTLSHIYAQHHYKHPEEREKLYLLQSNLTDLGDDSFLQRFNPSHTLKPKYKDPNKNRCTSCGKSFTCPHHLNTHQRIHTGEKPFSCKLCGKRFSDASNVKRHQNMHMAKKSFVCTLCGRAFTHSSCLTAHWRVHTGEKPFSCRYCGKQFSDASNLKRHLNTHLDKNP